jgi:hypothetical protein
MADHGLISYRQLRLCGDCQSDDMMRRVIQGEPKDDCEGGGGSGEATTIQGGR